MRRREHLVHTLINSGLCERIFFRAPNCASWRMTRTLKRWVTSRDSSVNAAANIEITDDNDLSRPACFDKIIEDSVDDVFVKRAFSAIRPQIEF